MIRSVSVICFLIFLIISCKKEEEKIPYEFLVFRDNNIKMWADTIPISVKDVIENGDYQVSDEKGSLICKGKFKGGFKTGEWMYHPTAAQTLTINWTQYFKEGKSIKINYPKDWEIHEDPERPFQASFPLKANENEKGKYFIILAHNRYSIKMDLKEYQGYYKSQTFSTEKVKEYAHFVFETTSGKSFYFMRYIIQRGDEEVLVLTFIGNNGSDIYDLTYSSSNEDYEKKHIIFFDMIRSLVIGEQRFFSPFDPVKEFKRFEYATEPQVSS